MKRINLDVLTPKEKKRVTELGVLHTIQPEIQKELGALKMLAYTLESNPGDVAVADVVAAEIRKAVKVIENQLISPYLG